jgi:hypothetical protein
MGRLPVALLLCVSLAPEAHAELPLAPDADWTAYLARDRRLVADAFVGDDALRWDQGVISLDLAVLAAVLQGFLGDTPVGAEFIAGGPTALEPRSPASSPFSAFSALSATSPELLPGGNGF